MVYYPAVVAGSTGVGCLNMDTQANCGYVPLENVANGTESGFVAQGGNIYGVGTDGATLCMTMSSQTPCAGEPFAAVVPGNKVGANGNFMGSLTVAQGKVFSSSNAAGSALIGCFDPATTAACTGWSAPRTAGSPNVGGTFNVYNDFDTAGTVIGACSTTSGQTTTSCYAIDGSPLADPGVFRTVPSGNDTWNAETARAPGGDLKSYFGAWGTIPGATVCYDWTAASPCAGFPALATHPSVNGGATRDYGYSFDATTQCLFGLGDAGFLFSEDPTTGASPRIHSGASVSLAPSGFYCDGGTNHSHGYTDATLEGINLANVDLGSSTADVTDPDGTASNDNVDCGPDGAGPWVKQAPQGLLGVLLAHPRWRITVTNHGPIDVTGVRINDQVEPTCVTAAGTFDLAAGASKQVFCSTSLLVSVLPLTNTASATFTPANSPQGTSSITTASSSAVACSLLCVLRG